MSAVAVPPLYEAADAALALFRAGLDTDQIARRMGIRESQASRYVWYGRSREKQLPADYVGREGEVRRISP